MSAGARGLSRVRDLDDEELAARAAAGDRNAFAKLVERNYDRVYRLAWRWTGRREMAEDIAQDVVVKLARAIRDFRAEARFSTWLYRLAYSTTVDGIRATQRIVPLGPSHMEELLDVPDGVTPEDAVEGQELWAAVRALPPQQRDAVLLVYGEDVSHQEAAKIMGCSEKTVSWHLHEARKRLKSTFEAVA